MRFSLQVSALEGLDIARDEPISLHTSEVPLRAALQAFEDAYPEMQFLIRDYGILLTARDYSAAYGYAPVLEPSVDLKRPTDSAEKP